MTTIAESATLTPVRSGRSWTDWVGFIAILTFAVSNFIGSRELGVLLSAPLAYDVAVALTFLIRGRPKRTLSGFLPRVAAYGASLLVPVFVRAALSWAPSAVASTTVTPVRIAGIVLWVSGLLLGLWPLWQLRRSFSIVPAARELVTSGPYRFARHPIYAAHILGYAGLWLLHATFPLALVVVLWFALMCLRVHYEEQLLMQVFPTYAAYRERVGAFGPWPFRPAAAKA